MATLSPRCCLVASRLHQTRCRASRSHAGPTKEAQHVRGSRREAYTRSSAASLHPRPEPVTKPVHRRVRQNLWVPRWCMRLQGGGQTKESALDEHEVDEGCPVFRRTTVTHIVSSLDPSWVESRVRRRMFGFARRWKQFILCTFWALAALDFAEVEGPGGNGEDGKGQPRETKGHPKPKGGELSLEDRLESAPAHRQPELRESRYGCFARRTRLARNLVLCVVPC